MIAQKLKYYRAVQRLTQRDVAESAGLGPGTIGKIEARDTDVTLSLALKVAKALDVTVEQLVGGLTAAEREQMRRINNRARELSAERKRAQRREQSRRDKERRQREAEWINRDSAA